MKVEIEGEGTITFKVGDSWVQSPEIRHNVLDFYRRRNGAGE